MKSSSRSVLDLLRAYESRNVTFVEADGSWPIVWQRARGVHVWDANGKRYVDLTAAFGVAAAGHANRAVVLAGHRQMSALLHAMGDVHPHALKALLARELSRVTFERWGRRSLATPDPGPSRPDAELSLRAKDQGRGKTIFCNSGSEAVEAALKTAMLATGWPGVLAFEGGYHGLGYGALNTTHRTFFRGPFRPQLREFGRFLPFPKDDAELARLESQMCGEFRKGNIGAVLVEPVQGRGGIHVPPPRFLPLLRRLCMEQGALLIVDEIYTGFGRTGRWFACEHTGVVPDLICLGKALTGGFPLAACVGRGDWMDAAWPPSSGEAIHTSTFLGHPVGCAMALAHLSEIRRQRLVLRSARLGRLLNAQLRETASESRLKAEARGIGLMAGIELWRADGSPASREAFTIVKRLLVRGFIVLPEGEHGNTISLTPPLTITESPLRAVIMALREELDSVTR